MGWLAAGIHLSPPNFVIFHRPVHALVCKRSGSTFDTIWAQFFTTSFLWIFNRLTGQSSAHTPRISARVTPLTPPIARSKQRQPPGHTKTFSTHSLPVRAVHRPAFPCGRFLLGLASHFLIAAPPQHSPHSPRPQPYAYLPDQITHAFYFCCALRWQFQTNLYCPFFPARSFRILINIFSILKTGTILVPGCP